MLTELSEFIADERNRFEGKRNNLFGYAFGAFQRYHVFVAVIR